MLLMTALAAPVLLYSAMAQVDEPASVELRVNLPGGEYFPLPVRVLNLKSGEQTAQLECIAADELETALREIDPDSSVTWYERDAVLRIELRGKRLSLYKRKIIAGGELDELTHPLQSADGNVYLPLKSVEALFGHLPDVTAQRVEQKPLPEEPPAQNQTEEQPPVGIASLESEEITPTPSTEPLQAMETDKLPLLPPVAALLPLARPNRAKPLIALDVSGLRLAVEPEYAHGLRNALAALSRRLEQSIESDLGADCELVGLDAAMTPEQRLARLAEMRPDALLILRVGQGGAEESGGVLICYPTNLLDASSALPPGGKSSRKLYFRPYAERSRRLAEALQSRFAAAGERPVSAVQAAPLYIPRRMDCPSVLIEIGRIANAADRDWFNQRPDYYADAIVQALKKNVYSSTGDAVR
ncbi:N-acetylmuramoyl-L-alanine amidase [Candidatus Sumerlaeota bacterium]|nr:N-acetylmuramoyl-L-alanine amidase [Candidatus Sumerlaeota bacterium]